MTGIRTSLIIIFLAFTLWLSGQTSIALVKYSGGGDWYANPTSLPNLVSYCNEQLDTRLETEIPVVELENAEIYNYPLLHITGHGNIILSPQEVNNLKMYLEAGGFLHISDNYGLNEYIRREMKKVFPDQEFIELPYDHPIYHQHFEFDNGLPKIHEHDDKPAQGFGLFVNNRLVCFYDYECDLGDGWEDSGVHHDPEEKREQALQMGANIIEFVFTGNEQ